MSLPWGERSWTTFTDEDQWFTAFASLSMFSQEAPEDLHNIATQDIATKEIGCDLLSAKDKGQKQLDTFIGERILPQESKKLKLRDPVAKNKPLTFASLFEMKRVGSGSSKEKAILSGQTGECFKGLAYYSIRGWAKC